MDKQTKRKIVKVTEWLNGVQAQVARLIMMLFFWLLLVDVRVALISVTVGFFLWCNACCSMQRWDDAGGIMKYYDIDSDDG